MRVKRRLRDKTERLAASVLEVPADTLEHVARITVTGHSQVTIENYRVFVEFTDRLIRVAVAGGEVAIRGQGLVMRTIVPEEVVVTGTICGIDFV